MTTWLPLTEYSSKHNVSISTLRRRIKADSIKYQFNDGRYLIFDQPSQEHRPSQASISEKLSVAPPKKNKETVSFSEAVSLENSRQARELAKENSEEPILTAANRLLSELKKAYTQILQEKEEQCLLCKTLYSGI